MALLLIAGLLIAAAFSLWHFPRNSRRLWKLTSRISAVVLMCASALPLIGFLFVGAMCGQYRFRPIASRDGKLFAQVREEDCGAPDHFHSSVELWRDREGFFAHILGKRGHDAVVFTVADDPRLIDLAWQDDRTLVIRYPNDNSRYADEYRCQSQSAGTRIQCVGYVPDYSKPVANMPPPRRWFW